jgi:short subunit dehydrogenase-like uncharacterized protein
MYTVSIADVVSILVVFGATGFTGGLTCEYLAEIKDKVRIFFFVISLAY